MSRNDKERKINKRTFVLFIAWFLIASGVYMAVSHTIKWTKGYMAVEQTSASEDVTSLEPGKDIHEGDGTSLYLEQPSEGQEIGSISIPKLEISIPVFEGTTEAQLEKGVGHYSGSVLPGENNNSVLSGHRDTVFRRLGEVDEGDVIIVETSAGEFTYRVNKIRIVDADDRTVIVPKPEASLTVTTCYPFTYIGDAPERYVLFGELIGSKTGNKVET